MILETNSAVSYRKRFRGHMDLTYADVDLRTRAHLRLASPREPLARVSFARLMGALELPVLNRDNILQPNITDIAGIKL